MTVASDDAPLMRRFDKAWIGHYWIQLLIAYDIATAPLLFLHSSWFSVATNCVIVIPGILLFMHGLAHEVKLCEPCQTKMPLDPAGHAVKRAKMLRAVHWLWVPVGGRRFSMSRGLLLYLLLFVVGFVLPSGPWWQIGNSAVADGFFYGMIIMSRGHQRLQPWCPQCRWGDGGEEEISPEPAPSHGLVPSGSA